MPKPQAVDPSKKEWHDELVKALYEGRTNRPYDRETAKTLPKASWGYLHKEAQWFDETLEATPDQIRGFYKWWRRTYEELSLPQVHDTIEREWTNFCLDVVHAAPEKRIQTGPIFDVAAWEKARAEAVSPEVAFADNPAVLNRILNGAEHYERRMDRRTWSMRGKGE